MPVGGFVGVQRDVILAAPVGRKEADHRPRRQPAFGDDLVQHGLGVGEQVAGLPPCSGSSRIPG
jgi:hypothetical protein